MTLLRSAAILLGRAGRAVSVLARTAFGLDTNPVPGDWTHVTKVDPEGEKRLPVVYPIYLQHTSAVSVGGSRDVTPANTAATFDLLDPLPTPAFHEPSAADHVTPETRDQAEFVAIPEVLNGDAEALVGTLGDGLRSVRLRMAPSLVEETFGWLPASWQDALADFATTWLAERAVFEAYLIQNPDSAAAREAGVEDDDIVNSAEAAQRATAAERHLGSEVIYLEYSGTFGGVDAEQELSAIDGAVSWSRVWYGGGLAGRDETERVREAGADAIVVGDAFHDAATAEAEAFDGAAEEFDGVPDRGDLRDWVRQNDPPQAATEYLATLRDVEDPPEQAMQYLLDGLLVRFEVRELACELPADPDADDVRAVVENADEIPGADLFHGVVNRPKRVAKRLVTGLLAERAGIEVDDALPAGHVA